MDCGFLSGGGSGKLIEPHTEFFGACRFGHVGAVWQGRKSEGKGLLPSPSACLVHGCLLKAKQTNALKSVIN